MLEHGTGYLSPVVSVLYHVHAQQVSSDGFRLQAGRRDVIASFSDRPWFTSRLLRDWDTSMGWDMARSAAQRDGDLVLAAHRLGRIAAHPSRVRGLAAVLVFRWRARRRTSQVGRSGAPTLAVVGAGPAGDVDGYERVRPSGGSRLARYAGLARRPTAALLVERRADRVAAKLLRIEALEGP